MSTPSVSHVLMFEYPHPPNLNGPETVSVEIRYRPRENDLLLVGLPVQKLDEQVMLDLTVRVGKRPERSGTLHLLTHHDGHEIGVCLPLRDMRKLLGIPHRRRNRTPGPEILARLVRWGHQALRLTIQRINCLDYPPTLF